MSIIQLALQKQALQIAHTDQDNFVQFIMDGAQSFLEKELNIFFPANDAAAVVTELISANDDTDDAFRYRWIGFDSFNPYSGAVYLFPKKHPVNAVTSVTDVITAETPTFALSGDCIVRTSPGSARPVPWTLGFQRYQVVYNAGYTPANCPMAIQQALVMLTCRAYEARSGETASGAAGESKSYGDLMSSNIMELVKPYSRRRRVSV